jgi:hypothetical protein
MPTELVWAPALAGSLVLASEPLSELQLEPMMVQKCHT